MKKINKLLNKLDACEEAQNWARGKTFEEVYTTCDRGDWLNWLFSRTNPEDIQLLTLVKGHQANTVRHLMKDERSREAVDTAIAFGEGRATKEELKNAAAAADAGYAAEDASYFSVCAASYASDVADYSARAASYAAACAACAARAADSYAAVAADAAARAAAVAEQDNRLITADIFRKYISMDKFKI